MTWAELVAQRGRSQRTEFATPAERDPAIAPVRIRTGGPGRMPRHQQVASIHRHGGGDLLVTCRWDAVGDAEGDATNEQALYLSRDDGRTWDLANDGWPAITLAQGTSFERPSAITHAFVFEDGRGRTWLYYTINQPYTWGPGRPDRATGGGEIRRVALHEDGGAWRTAAASEVVWPFRRPVPDGRGGTRHDVRMICLNGIVRLRDGRLLMPVAGRATVDEPRGAFWRLDRCWVLRSEDDGASWDACFFLAGSEALCLCEPTIVETATDGRLVALMRSQYESGRELYRSDSADGGETWTAPRPTGLPNTGGSGVKPYLTRLSCGAYALLQTNEHDITDRTNIALFVTDEDGLAADRWPLVRVVGSECERHWLGSMYGWVTEADGGHLHAVWVSYHRGLNHLNYARLDPAWAMAPVVEPVAPRDDDGDDLPRFDEAAGGLRFPNTRSRAHLPRLLASVDETWHLRLDFDVERLPEASDFHLLELRSRNGADLSCRVAFRPRHGGRVWLDANQGWCDTGHALERGSALSLRLTVAGEKRVSLVVGDAGAFGGRVASGTRAVEAFLKTAAPISSAIVGGAVRTPEPCSMVLRRAVAAPGSEA